MLGSLCDVPKAINLYKGSLPLSSDTGGDATDYLIEADVTSNTYIAPIKVSTSNDYNRVVSYTLKDILQPRIIGNNDESIESILLTLYNGDTSPIRSICNLMTPTTPKAEMKVTGVSNIAASLKPTSAFKSVKFDSGLKQISAFLNFPRASMLEVDGIQT